MTTYNHRNEDERQEALARFGFDCPEVPVFRPLRQSRAPYVKPGQFFRRCQRCGTDFMATEGGASERGPWGDGMRWYCSVECIEGSESTAEKSSNKGQSNG